MYPWYAPLSFIILAVRIYMILSAKRFVNKEKIEKILLSVEKSFRADPF